MIPIEDLFRFDSQHAASRTALTAWIAAGSLLVILVQLVVNSMSGIDSRNVLISILAFMAMGSILLLLIFGRTRAARRLLPVVALISANAYLLTADNPTPIQFVAINSTVILITGAVLSHLWVLAIASACAALAAFSIVTAPDGWIHFAPVASHGWGPAIPLFLFTVMFIFLTTWQRNHAQTEASARAAEAETLREASAIVTASLDLNETIERILQQLGRVVPHDTASVQILGDGYLEIIGGRGWDNLDEVVGLRFDLAAASPNKIVVETGQPYILNNAPNQHPEFRSPPHDHILSWLGVPLRIGDHVSGMLSVDSSRPDMYGQRHARLTLGFADAVAIALENAHHFEAEQRRRQLAAMQLDIMEAAGSSLELEPLLERIAAMTTDAVQALFSTIYLTPIGESQLSLAAFHVPSHRSGTSHEALRSSLQQLASTSVVRQALDRHRATVLDSEAIAAALPSTPQDPGHLTELLVAPLYARQGILGAIILGAGDLKPSFDPDEIILIEMISHSVAGSIENARLYSQTEQMAITDSLTGLYNRRGLFQFGQREVERSRRYDRPISVLMVDLDHFKQLNDSYGHMAGDEVLASVASRINQSVRRIDVAGRYGGEEFLILLPECGLEFARGVAERIRQSIENDPISSAVGPVQASVSVGVANSVNSPLQLEDLIGRADDALYQAKQAGRNCVRLWEPDEGESPGPGSRQEQGLS